jgi:trk system potassium uptake protein TrkA
MKIVVGGASNVGKSIVGYLSLGNNDIVVVDEDPAKLDEIAKEYDVQPVLGSISHPDVQELVGMKNMDMLIAVTDSDEVNMVACQVAFTLFSVPTKIARVDSKYFLNPLWNTLYNEKSLPIDLVITPDVEIGKFILNLLNLPGSQAVYPFMNGELNIFAFRYRDTDTPFTQFSVSHINLKLAELEARIVFIMRGNRRILPTDEEIRLQRNDVVYIGCKPERNMEIIRMFGVDHNPYEKAVLFGANAISYYVASELEKNDSMVNCNIVEDNPKRAQKLAEALNRASVITGEMLSDVILEDAGFDSADNVLGTNIRNNVIIDRAVITISGILNYLRRARIREAYALGRNMGEIWELRIGSDNSNLGKSVADLGLPRDSAIMLVYRSGKLIDDFTDYRIMADDKILIYVSPNDIRRIEQIFYL